MQQGACSATSAAAGSDIHSALLHEKRACVCSDQHEELSIYTAAVQDEEDRAEMLEEAVCQRCHGRGSRMPYYDYDKSQGKAACREIQGRESSVHELQGKETRLRGSMGQRQQYAINLTGRECSML